MILKNEFFSGKPSYKTSNGNREYADMLKKTCKANWQFEWINDLLMPLRVISIGRLTVKVLSNRFRNERQGDVG
jgi:hypothetical protein